MTLTDIRQHDLRLITKVLGYKMHCNIKLNSVSAGVIQTTYKMVVEQITYKMVVEHDYYDICEIFKQQLLENVRRIKHDNFSSFQIWIIDFAPILPHHSQVP